jgi:hypothetical protein
MNRHSEQRNRLHTIRIAPSPVAMPEGPVLHVLHAKETALTSKEEGESSQNASDNFPQWTNQSTTI